MISSLPFYFMSIIQLPAKVKTMLEKIQKDFLWSGCAENRKIYLVKWDLICKDKDSSGLGIIDLRLKNKALLNKWIWWYANEPDSLWCSVISIKNGSASNSLLPQPPSYKSSQMWSHICKPLLPSNKFHSLVHSNIGYFLGCGSRIRFSLDD